MWTTLGVSVWKRQSIASQHVRLKVDLRREEASRGGIQAMDGPA
jgi:hypothetical protein